MLRVISIFLNKLFWVVSARSLAYMKHYVPNGVGWSLIYMLNSKGANTIPYASPFDSSNNFSFIAADKIPSISYRFRDKGHYCSHFLCSKFFLKEFCDALSDL